MGMGSAPAHRFTAHQHQLQHRPLGLGLHIGKQLQSQVVPRVAQHGAEMGRGAVVHLGPQLAHQRVHSADQIPGWD